jgi:putative oxidoreductase
MTSRPNETARVAARALMALIFLVAGVRKAMAYGATLGYFKSLGLPLPELVLPLTIALEIGGAIALVAGWRLRWVGPVMALFTFGTALAAHRFWEAPDAQYAAQLNNFLKNVAMVGGFVLVTLSAREPRE